MDADIFISGKKKLRTQKYPDTCGRGLRDFRKAVKGALLSYFVAQFVLSRRMNDVQEIDKSSTRVG